MHDWRGSRARQDALVVGCRYCGAIPGEQCVTKTDDRRPLEAFPAHICRTTDARAEENPCP